MNTKPANYKPDNYWTKERCHQEALKYTTRRDFYTKSYSAYSKATSKGWLYEITTHLPNDRFPRGYWTKEQCAKEAKKYEIRKDFHIQSPSGYLTALKNGWLDEICTHMRSRKPMGYWTKERCWEIAKRYKIKRNFRENNPSLYAVLGNNGWTTEMTAHMRGETDLVWTKEACFEEAKKYKTTKEFKEKCHPGYQASHRLGIFQEVTSHMKVRKSNNYWTKERCINVYNKYETFSDFYRENASVYNAIKRNGWEKEIYGEVRNEKK